MDHSAMNDYMAHGFCFLWEPRLVWLHVISDIVTGIAYFSIPVAMGYFIYKRRDLPYPYLFVIFALFIFSCGGTHFLSAYTVFVPRYWEEGYLKAVTALISSIAVILFIPKIPKAIVLPSLPKALKDIRELNAKLAAQLEELTREIMERKQAESALLKSEMEFGNLVENAPLAITVVNKAGEIEYLNRKNVEIIGYTREETPTLESWWSVAYPDPDERKKNTSAWGDIQQRILNGENIGVTERAITCKDGATKDVELRFSKAGEKVLVIFNDITERNRAERELQRYSAKLETSNKELQEALASVKTLSGMLPICASCKKIRDDKGYWSQVETYVSRHSEAVFTSGVCPDCEKKMYAELDKLKKKNS